MKEGFGSLAEVRELPANEALEAFHYVVFLSDYQETMIQINRDAQK